MSLFGTQQLAFDRFGGGLVTALDPVELDEDQASAGSNVDFRDFALAVRKGRTVYNSAAPVASPVRGLHRYYSRTGSGGTFVMQAGTSIYEDNGAGTFSAASGTSTGLTGGVPYDFCGWKELLYGGSSVDALRKRSAAGSWSTVALLAAPSAAPTVALYQTTLESFDSGTWTLSGANWTSSYVTDPGPLEGANCLKLSAGGASGITSSRNKVWSGAATVDLSKADYLVVWYWSEKVGINFKVGIFTNGTDPTATTPTWANFPVQTTTQKEAWVPIYVPLSAIAPADRTASPGLGIQYVSKRSNLSYPFAVYFDQALAVVNFETDTYHYQATYATVDSNGAVTAESNPTATGSAGSVKIDKTKPQAGVLVTTPGASGDAATNVIRLWRHREHGTYSKPRLVGTMPDGTTTLNGGITSTATSITVADTTGMSAGCVLTIGTEKLLVLTVPTSTTLTVSRAFNNTTAASALNGVTVTTSSFLDQKSDGQLLLEDAEELQSNKLAPPLAATYAIVNGRLLAGGVVLSGTAYPWRLYLSRQGFPEEFSTVQEPNGDIADASGWVDIRTKDHIQRIVEFDGQALLFCDRSIWALEGTGWDDFALRKRADVGLVAREAVCVTDRLVYFLATDGVRVLSPNMTQEGLFETWVISEPVDDTIRSIPLAYRKNCAMGQDGRGRIHLSLTRSGQTVADAALVFDPFLPGALGADGYDVKRRGWTYYGTNWGYSVFCQLKRGEGDAGQLIGGDPSTAKIYYLQRSSADADIATDDGSAIVWSWQSKSTDAGPGSRLNWTMIALEADACASQTTTLNGAITASAGSLVVASATGFAINDYLQIDSEVMLVTNIAGTTFTVTRAQGGTEGVAHSNAATITLVQAVTCTPVLDEIASSTTYVQAFGTRAAGVALPNPPQRRTAPGIQARHNQLKLSGSQKVALRIRGARVGVWART